MEMDDFSNAIDYYEQATDYRPNEYFTPVYLKKLAIARENNGDLTGAASAYGIVIEKYPRSPHIHDAKKQKARLEASAL